MQEYNAVAQLDLRCPTDPTALEDLLDRLVDHVEEYSGVVSRATTGRLLLTFTLPATSLRQALLTAAAVSETALPGVGVVALEVLPTEEFDRRSEEETIPDMLSVTGAAAVLGVGRARVKQLIADGKLAAVKIGEVWAVPRRAAEARAGRRRADEPAGAAGRPGGR